MTNQNIQRRDFLGSTLTAAGITLGLASAAEAARQPKKKAESATNKIGMNLLLWTANPNEEHFPLLEKLKGMGFDGVELPMFDGKGTHWGKMGKFCDEIGLERTVSTAMPQTANPVSEEPSIRRNAVELLKALAERSHEAGATLICGPLYSPVGKLVGRGRNDDEFKWAVEVLRAASEHAQQENILFSNESLNRFETYVFNSQEDCAKLAQEVNMPNFGVHYDTFHANIEEKDPGATIRKVAKAITHVHLSENDRSTPGKGQVAWKETFAALKDINYDRWLVIEAFGKSLPEVAAATCIWRKMYESEEQLASDGIKFVRNNWA